MIKIIVILGLAAIAYVLYQRLSANFQGMRLPKEKKPNVSPANKTMLKCEQCGIFSPETQCIVKNNSSFCSPEHAALFDKKDNDNTSS